MRLFLPKLPPDRDQGKDVYYQGFRQMTNSSRRYYERELGAGAAANKGYQGWEQFGYTEPLRRFIQRESFDAQANEIENMMPSWMPGEDYMLDFKHGDPYVKLDDGYARLPGAGYEALHPELEGINPEDYPDIYKMSILADVAPYSRQYNTFAMKVSNQAKNDTQLEIEYEKIRERVRQTRSLRPASTKNSARRRARTGPHYMDDSAQDLGLPQQPCGTCSRPPATPITPIVAWTHFRTPMCVPLWR